VVCGGRGQYPLNRGRAGGRHGGPLNLSQGPAPYRAPSSTGTLDPDSY
jgi:hypothetical protein